MGRCAFTLAEMLVVLAIIAALSGSVIVTLADRDEIHKLRAATNDLATAIHYAAATSRARGLNHRLSFDESHRRFQVETARVDAPTEYEPAVGQTGIWRPLPDDVRIDRVVVDGLPLDQLPDRLEFPAGGEGFVGQIELSNALGESMHVQVMPRTRQVMVVQP